MPTNGKLHNAIVCDDVRREQGTNKHFLIGVFSGDFVVPAFPAAIAPALYIEYLAETVGEIEFTITYTATPKVKLPQVRGRVTVTAPGMIAITIPQLLIEVTEPSTFSAKMAVGRDRPMELFRKRIVDVSQTTNASLPPSSPSSPDAPAS